MNRFEKYRNAVTNYGNAFCKQFVKPQILNLESCAGIHCNNCRTIQLAWLLTEPEETEVDWSKVKVDTPILVRDYDDESWRKRYFAKYENKQVYAWVNGGTSWSEKATINWKYAKLAEVEDEKDNT